MILIIELTLIPNPSVIQIPEMIAIFGTIPIPEPMLTSESILESDSAPKSIPESAPESELVCQFNSSNFGLSVVPIRSSHH